MLLMLLAHSIPTQARADESDGPAPSSDAKAEATALHERAEAALATGDWTAACPLYSASQALDPSAPTQGRVAQCLEHEGMLASALRAYQAALELVPRLDETRRRLAAQRFPRYIQELEPRVPHFTWRVAPELDALTVQLDGAALRADDLRTSLRVDPGSHRLVVNVSGFVEQSCELAAREGARVEIEIAPPAAGVGPGCQSVSDALLRIVLAQEHRAVAAGRLTHRRSDDVTAAPAQPNAASAPAASVPAVAYPLAMPAREPAHEALVRRRVGYVVGGVGAASLVAAAYWGVRTLVLVDGAHCNAAGECDERGAQRMSDAQDAQLAGFIALGAGAALLGAGALLLWTGPSAEGEPAAWKVGLAPRGAWLEAQW